MSGPRASMEWSGSADVPHSSCCLDEVACRMDVEPGAVLSGSTSADSRTSMPLPVMLALDEVAELVRNVGLSRDHSPTVAEAVSKASNLSTWASESR